MRADPGLFPLSFAMKIPLIPLPVPHSVMRKLIWEERRAILSVGVQMLPIFCVHFFMIPVFIPSLSRTIIRVCSPTSWQRQHVPEATLTRDAAQAASVVCASFVVQTMMYYMYRCRCRQALVSTSGWRRRPTPPPSVSSTTSNTPNRPIPHYPISPILSLTIHTDIWSHRSKQWPLECICSYSLSISDYF